MAGDWIKMRGNLWDDPRISGLCDLTDCGEAQIIGGLYWLWSSADQHSTDGLMEGLTLKAIDRKTGIQGFGSALASIGWISVENDEIRISRFEEHNGSSAKKRAQSAKRVANHKSGNAQIGEIEETGNADAIEIGDLGNAPSVTGNNEIDESGNAVSVTEIENQRYLEKEKEKDIKKEKEKKHTPNASKAGCKSPPLLGAQDLIAEGVDRQHAEDWLRVRQGKKLPLTRTAWEGMKTEAAKAGLTIAEAVRESALRSWAGFKAEWYAREGQDDRMPRHGPKKTWADALHEELGTNEPKMIDMGVIHAS